MNSTTTDSCSLIGKYFEATVVLTVLKQDEAVGPYIKVQSAQFYSVSRKLQDTDDKFYRLYGIANVTSNTIDLVPRHSRLPSNTAYE